MISSASTLLLATLVFNAASVLGAPIRMVTVEPVARAEITPVQPVARAPIVDVQDNRRRSLFGRVSRRSARLVSERDVPFSEFVEVREPAVEAVAPAVEARERRYPRRVLHDFYKRDPATSVEESLTFNKVTVHDTPADAAAFNFGDVNEHQSDKKPHDQKPPCTTDAGAKVAPTVAVPAPAGLPTNVPNVSTTITVSTIIPNASAPAATAPAVVAPVVNATPAVPVPAAPTADPAANGAIPQASPLPASSSSPAPVAPAVNAPAPPSAGPADGSVPVVAGGNPSATSTIGAAQGNPTDVPATPAGGADPAATSPAAAATTPAAASPATSTGTSSPAPNNTTPAADGTTTPSTNGSPVPGGDANQPTSPATDAADAAINATFDASTPAARRSVGRRTLAVSGPSWASAVRRELSNN